MIKSPLRYPGGKSKAIKFLINYLPPHFLEYREPFIGGGSLFIYLRQKYPKLKFWINDLNPELFLFWSIAQSHLDQLVTGVQNIKNSHPHGKELFMKLVEIKVQELSDLERAIRFFVLNRITFSGTAESGGFSQGSFEKRFTDSSIARLTQLRDILEGVKITHLDYSQVIFSQGNQVFIYLDPPYYSATASRLYGKRGNLHTHFNHNQFSENIRKCDHLWMITYDNSPEIKANFQSFYCYDWLLQYGMNNVQQKKADKGKELLVLNYPIYPSHQQQMLTEQLTLVF